MGGHGERVENPHALLPALHRAVRATEEGRPAVVDAVVDPTVVSAFMANMTELGLM